jgi:hypothetical protein
MVCRGLLLMLHRAGAIELPAVRWVNPNPFVRRQRPAAMRKPGDDVELASLGARLRRDETAGGYVVEHI